MQPLADYVDTARWNATASWALVLVLLAAGVESLLTPALLWAAFVFATVGVVIVPPIASGDWTMLPPLPHLTVLAGAILVRSAGVAREVAGIVAVATLAVIVVVELEAVTPVEMSRRFAVAFAVLTTMAIQGWVVIGEFYSDQLLGTAFIASQTELQWDLVVVGVVALVLGLASELYFAGVESDHAPAGRPG